MRYDEAGPARILRSVDGRWVPVGPVLPPVEDDDLHDPHAHRRPVVWWHMHRSTDIAAGDVLVARERAWLVLDRCGPRHHAVQALAAHIRSTYDDPEWCEDWLAGRQVWSMRPLDHAMGGPGAAATARGRGPHGRTPL